MKLIFSKNCAWRAVYVYAGIPQPYYAEAYGKQIAHLGFDPKGGNSRPQIFGGVAFRKFFWNFRISLPALSWRLAAKFRILLPIYELQERILHSLDGRFR